MNKTTALLKVKIISRNSKGFDEKTLNTLHDIHFVILNRYYGFTKEGYYNPTKITFEIPVNIVNPKEEQLEILAETLYTLIHKAVKRAIITVDVYKVETTVEETLLFVKSNERK